MGRLVSKATSNNDASYLRDLANLVAQRQMDAIQHARDQRLEDAVEAFFSNFATPRHVIAYGSPRPSPPTIPAPQPKTPAEQHASFVSRFLEHGADAL